MTPQYNAMRSMINECKRIEIDYKEIETDLSTSNSAYIVYTFNEHVNTFDYSEKLEKLYVEVEEELEENNFKIIDSCFRVNYLKNLRTLYNKLTPIYIEHEDLLDFETERLALEELREISEYSEMYGIGKFNLPEVINQNNLAEIESTLWELIYAKCLIIKRLQELLLSTIELLEKDENDNPNHKTAEDMELLNVGTQKIVLLNELGILNILGEQCNTNGVVNTTHVAYLIFKITGINSETVRKQIDTIFHSQKENRNYPYKNPKNLNTVLEILRKVKINK